MACREIQGDFVPWTSDIMARARTSDTSQKVPCVARGCIPCINQPYHQEMHAGGVMVKQLVGMHKILGSILIIMPVSNFVFSRMYQVHTKYISSTYQA
jgi:hypothetical protein